MSFMRRTLFMKAFVFHLLLGMEMSLPGAYWANSSELVLRLQLGYRSCEM